MLSDPRFPILSRKYPAREQVKSEKLTEELKLSSAYIHIHLVRYLLKYLGIYLIRVLVYRLGHYGIDQRHNLGVKSPHALRMPCDEHLLQVSYPLKRHTTGRVISTKILT